MHKPKGNNIGSVVTNGLMHKANRVVAIRQFCNKWTVMHKDNNWTMIYKGNNWTVIYKGKNWTDT